MMVTAGTDGDNVGFLPPDDDLLKLKAGDHDSLFSFFFILSQNCFSRLTK